MTWSRGTFCLEFLQERRAKQTGARASLWTGPRTHDSAKLVTAEGESMAGFSATQEEPSVQSSFREGNPGVCRDAVRLSIAAVGGWFVRMGWD